jgi:hypothetical protein
MGKLSSTINTDVRRYQETMRKKMKGTMLGVTAAMSFKAAGQDHAEKRMSMASKMKAAAAAQKDKDSGAALNPITSAADGEADAL